VPVYPRVLLTAGLKYRWDRASIGCGARGKLAVGYLEAGESLIWRIAQLLVGLHNQYLNQLRYVAFRKVQLAIGRKWTV
jgi:hypothetical protein